MSVDEGRVAELRAALEREPCACVNKVTGIRVDVSMPAPQPPAWQPGDVTMTYAPWHGRPMVKRYRREEVMAVGLDQPDDPDHVDVCNDCGGIIITVARPE